MPYAAVNDIQATMNHEHGGSPFDGRTKRHATGTGADIEVFLQCLPAIW